jgi:hypothetical protein
MPVRDKNLSAVLMGIKDALTSAFAPHLSKIPPTADGWTMQQHIDALARHFVPMAERFFNAPADPHAENSRAIAELRSEIAFLRDRLGPVGSVGSAMVPPEPAPEDQPPPTSSSKILSLLGRKRKAQ